MELLRSPVNLVDHGAQGFLHAQLMQVTLKFVGAKLKFKDNTLLINIYLFILKCFCQTHTSVLFWDYWYSCCGFLVMSPLGFKAREGSALFTFV